MKIEFKDFPKCARVGGLFSDKICEKIGFGFRY